jgi:hypothetical protein
MLSAPATVAGNLSARWPEIAPPLTPSVAEGPVVEIYIGTEGLPPLPKPVKRPDKRKKSRPA